MDTVGPSVRFFSKLRSLAVRLETEKGNLEHSASRKINEDDEDTESGAVQALHELHSEVRDFKKQVQGQVAYQKNESEELKSFVNTCMVLKHRTTEDIERIKRHYEKYGYKPRKTFQKKTEVNGQGEADNQPLLEKQPDKEPAEDMAGDGREEEVQESAQEPETPQRMPSPAVDPMRTPQLADFGLSTLHLQMFLSKAKQSLETPSLPPMALSPSSPAPFMTIHPFQPRTPKCSLNMDEDAPTPRLEDFGITEHTMCLNNDFTMDLFRKKQPRNRQVCSTTEAAALRTPQDPPFPPSCARQEKFSSESLESPELPVFYTLDLKINKQMVPSSTLPNSLQSPPCHQSPTAAATPELPTFETPYISKLISAKKEIRQDKHDGLAGSLNSMSNTSECPAVRQPSAGTPQKPTSFCVTQETTPEMPHLQSFFSRSLPCMVGSNHEPPHPMLPTNDDHTEDLCMASPRVRMKFQVEPCTPEMPDMSSVTQDILKLVSQGNCKPVPNSSVQQDSKADRQKLAFGKENRAQVVGHVSEKEFNGLPSYMKQISLASLNQAINKLNLVLKEQCRDGDPNSEVFHMDDLRSILEVGPHASMYIFSLVELKRLEKGFGRNAAFKILTKT